MTVPCADDSAERRRVGNRMALAEVHDSLVPTHPELLEHPRFEVEGLTGASCGPHVKHLAQVALDAAWQGRSADRWRAAVADGMGEHLAAFVDEAEACMRGCGLWPWP